MISDIDSEDDQETGPPAAPPPGQGGAGGESPPTPPRPPEQPRRLMRSNDRKIAGVAGGIAEYFNIDPVIVRLGFVIAMFAGGVGVIAYLVAWVVLPESDGQPQPPRNRTVDASTVIAIVLLGLAVAFGVSDPFDGGVIASLILVGAGVFLLHQRPLDRLSTPEGASTVEPPTEPPPRVSAEHPAPAFLPTEVDSTREFDIPPPAPPQPRPRPPQAIVTRIAISTVALVFAGAITFDTLGWLDADVSAVIALGVLVIGVAAIVAAFVGRGRGLIPLGILLTLAFAGSAVVEPVIEDGIGDRSHAPTSIAEVKPVYDLGIGRLEVDLRELEIPEGTTLEVEVDLGIGEAVVYVPQSVDLQLAGDVDVGEIALLESNGPGLGRTRTEENGTRNELRLSRDGDGNGTLVLEVDVVIGSGRVERV